MKKISFFLNCAASAMFAIALTACNATEDNPGTGFDPSLKTIQSGDTLSTFVDQIANNVILEIPAGVDTVYTGAIEIVEGQSLIIVGDETINPVIVATNAISTAGNVVLKNVVIDGANTEEPIVQLAATVADKSIIDEISFTNVTVNNLKFQLFYANKKKALINNLIVENSIIAVKGANQKTLFDFNGGGLARQLSINNSTLYADGKTKWKNGGLLSTQSGSKLNELECDLFKVSITNSTLDSICAGKQTATLRQNNIAENVFVVKNSIISNCGKSGQFLFGLTGNNGNKGKNLKTKNCEFDNNVFVFGGELVYEKRCAQYNDEYEDDADGHKAFTAAINSIPANPQFRDAANGNFRPTNLVFLNLKNAPGDPRWTKWVLK